MAINQMPHNLDAEAALLGCILIDEEIQSELLEQLREEDFYQESHREILNAMRAVYGGRVPVDVVTLTDRLDRDGKLERAGGLQYITELAQITPSAANYKQYLTIVRRDAVNRALIRAAKDIIENSMKGEEERDAISFAEKAVYDISKREDNNALMGIWASSKTSSPTPTPSAASRRALSTSTASRTACKSPTSSCSPPVPAWARRRFP